MSNELMNINNMNTTKTMTSKEIAELTNKQHQHVKRDIKKLIEDGAVSAVSNQSKLGRVKIVSYKDAKGEEREMYELDFKATMTLVTGYDAKRRALVVNRWIALETGEATPAIQMMQTKPDTISSQYKESEAVIRATLKIGKLLGTAEPMAKAIAVEEARRVTGLDHSKLLPLANVQEVPLKTD